MPVPKPAPRSARAVAALCLLAAAGLGSAAQAVGDVPDVVVSLKPVHSLVAGVMAGVGEPTLLIPATASPHAYSLRPSDARALSRADLVFWVGGGMEAFLETPLDSLAGGAEVVALSAAPGVRLLKTRAGGVWEAHDEHEHAPGENEPGENEPAEHDHGEPEHGEAEAAHGDDDQDDDGRAHRHGDVNLHIWLDPENAVAIVRAAAEALSAIDPGRAADYARNADAMIDRLTALDRELRADLAPVRETPFVVFHDAYHYFERHYGLAAVGSITVSPERPPGAGRLSEIRDKIRGLGASCVFSEPQVSPAIVRTVMEGTSAREGVLDPLGIEVPAGPEAYFGLMRGLADAMRTCLAVGS